MPTVNEELFQLSNNDHPVLKGKYYIPTRVTYEVLEEINRIIINRTPGGIIYGPPRFGKTMAIEIISNALKQLYGDTLPVYKLYCNMHGKPTEDKFFTLLLTDIGHGLATTGKDLDKRIRFINYLIQQATKNEQRRIVLFFDEAQRLSTLEYGFMTDIYNQLEKEDIDVTSILVGQKELAYTRAGFIASGQTQIVGRFMCNEYEFHGVRTVEDLKFILNAYDQTTEYPTGSQCSYTKYFFERAFMDGARLENDAEKIYNIFVKKRKEANLAPKIDIPMFFITKVIDTCFRTFGITGEKKVWPTEESWEYAIDFSNYINFDKLAIPVGDNK